MSESIGGVNNVNSSFWDQANYKPQATKGTNFGNTVFTDKQTNELGAQDFLNLMMEQLKNQDFMNPVDDAQFLSQLAQFSSMQYMQELANFSKQNYVSSLIGQTVTASKFTVSGNLDTTTGVVDKISLVDDEYLIYIGDKSYSLDQIMEIGATTKKPGSSDDTPTTPPEDEDKTDYTQSSFLMSLLGQNVTVKDANDIQSTGIVQKVSMTDGMRFMVNGVWYGLDDFVSVNSKDEASSGELDDTEDDEIVEVLPPENSGNPDDSNTTTDPIVDTENNVNGADAAQQGIENGTITPDTSEA
jgi:flagellar hook assembly protein FlgD